MTSKLLKKVVGALGYKLFDKNYVVNTRLISNNSSLNIKTLLNYFFENGYIENLIQIGANDGENFDELSYFIKRFKTESILVEPIYEHIQKLKETYSSHTNIKLENAAIFQEEEKKYLFSVKKEFREIYGNHAKAISSFTSNHLLKHGIKKKHIEKIEVKSISINQLLEKYKINKVDLFYCDAEGYDGNIVLGLLKSKIQCKIIIFEYIHVEKEKLEDVLNFLKKENFKYFSVKENLFCFKNTLEIKI
tara:strand:+ start:830 stop:1573 length:744 start_codon:yes stop_codon:yes gene_type:complete